ncbi:cation diffusion facilitator family transporter [Georgenia alba]|uniref:Cation diffusion facilitator family transporter n=1 Tax=Georgenia alba TaxID=2233858 RepID=A0ABW2QDW6_9MICO
MRLGRRRSRAGEDRARFGHTELPDEQEQALRRAVRLEWTTIGFLCMTIVLVFLVMGRSQAMKAAFVEDALSLIPPIAFLVAVRVTRRRPSARHPYGYHRAVGVGHLVAATALFVMGAMLVVDSSMSLLAAEHPPIGLLEIGGWQVWGGWLMIAVMAWSAVPPVLLGRAKMPLSETLHDRVLHADADMNRADWMTAVATIVGVLGIGVGLWWMDAVAALFVSGGILRDGVRNLRTAVSALIDARAATYDGQDTHPLVRRIDERLEELDWVEQARSRVRDQGHVFHVEAFVVPVAGRAPSLRELVEAREACVALDWKVDDMVVIPSEELPERMLPGVREELAGGHDADR